MLKNYMSRGSVLFGGMMYDDVIIHDWHMRSSVVKVIMDGIENVQGVGVMSRMPAFMDTVRATMLAATSDPFVPIGIVQLLLPPDLPEGVAVADRIKDYLPVPRYSQKQAKDAGSLPQTVTHFAPDYKDASKNDVADVARVKFFWPEYGYGGCNKADHGMCPVSPIFTKCRRCRHEPIVKTDGCGAFPPEVRAFAQALMDATRGGSPICKLPNINAVSLNVYEYRKQQCLLDAHVDGPHIFKRPIYSYRLFSPAKLAFVAGKKKHANYSKGGDPNWPIFFEVPLPVGCLTEMSGFAASALMHCVRDGGQPKTRTASLILRSIHEELLDEEWLTNNLISRVRIPQPRLILRLGPKADAFFSLCQDAQVAPLPKRMKIVKKTPLNTALPTTE